MRLWWCPSCFRLCLSACLCMCVPICISLGIKWQIKERSNAWLKCPITNGTELKQTQIKWTFRKFVWGFFSFHLVLSFKCACVYFYMCVYVFVFSFFFRIDIGSDDYFIIITTLIMYRRYATHSASHDFTVWSDSSCERKNKRNKNRLDWTIYLAVCVRLTLQFVRSFVCFLFLFSIFLSWYVCLWFPRCLCARVNANFQTKSKTETTDERKTP